LSHLITGLLLMTAAVSHPPRWGLAVLLRLQRWMAVEPRYPTLRALLVLVALFAALMLLHLMQVSLWALLYWWQIGWDLNTALYFSTTTYATIGYGDVVPPAEWRLVAVMEGLTGVLMLGWSSALVFAIVMRSWGSQPGGGQSGSLTPAESGILRSGTGAAANVGLVEALRHFVHRRNGVRRGYCEASCAQYRWTAASMLKNSRSGRASPIGGSAPPSVGLGVQPHHPEQDALRAQPLFSLDEQLERRVLDVGDGAAVERDDRRAVALDEGHELVTDVLGVREEQPSLGSRHQQPGKVSSSG